MKLGRPFDRKQALMYIDKFIGLHYGSYSELIQLTVRDLAEIDIALDSKAKEAQISSLLG